MKKFIGLMGCVVLSTALLTGCGKKDDTTIEQNILKVSNGDTITLVYSSHTANIDKETIETDIEKTITVGENKLFPNFDNNLIGKEKDKTFSFVAPAKNAYQNQYSDGNIQQIPEEVFSATDTKVEKGQKLDLGEVSGIVEKIEDGYIWINTNPIYLDKKVEFTITIKDIVKK